MLTPPRTVALIAALLGVVPQASGQGACSSPDAFEPNQSCGSPVTLANGQHPGLNVSLQDPDFYTFGVDAGATVSVAVLHSVADADVDAFLYQANGCNGWPGDPECDFTLACGYTGSDDEVLSWTNATGSQVNCTLRVTVWPDSVGTCAPYELQLSGANGPGGPGYPGGSATTAFCAPGQVNSTGSAASLAGAWLGGQLLSLQASSGPDNQFGYFVVSGSTTAGVSISDGLLCLGSPIGRYNAGAGAARNSLGQFQQGAFVNLSGTATFGYGFDVPASLPGPINGSIQPGQAWHFQLWYRDIGGVSNFTNGVTAQW